MRFKFPDISRKSLETSGDSLRGVEKRGKKPIGLNF